MKIDLEKELGLDKFGPTRPSPWLQATGAAAVAALLLAIVAVSLSLRSANQSPQGLLLDGLAQSQAVDDVQARIVTIEKSMRDLRTTFTDYKMSMKELVAQNRIDERRDRIKEDRVAKSALDTSAVAHAAGMLGVMGKQSPVSLSDSDRRTLDVLVDSDEAGTQIRSYLQSITNVPLREACLKHLLQKADGWTSSATRLEDDDPKFASYADNALYFYDVVAEVGTDSGLIAYAEAKRSQIRFEGQRRDIRLSAQQEADRLQEQIAKLEERLKLQEELEKKRREPPPAPYKRVYKP